uniref:Neurotoxin 3FTx-8a n=1 Tax=Bungarus fasciatus TaxID=8613 RepID=3NO28_BUNFA|nr:RecName: Full=Neurotoxin 3FTx-8a; AltName: Full=3FTx-VIIIa; Flags: Precursor [Bungarus fasciatus]ABI33870.1 three finger toxin [Bungarus fasciatus]
MKTLLLTLVVVTIVCLDLGYTLTCLICPERYCQKVHTCRGEEKLCVKRFYDEKALGWRAKRGCAATCPEAKPKETVECCSTDKCNK